MSIYLLCNGISQHKSRTLMPSAFPWCFIWRERISSWWALFDIDTAEVSAEVSGLYDRDSGPLVWWLSRYETNLNEPAHEGTYHIVDQRRLRWTCASAHLARAFAVRTHETWMTKNQTSSPTGWLRMMILRRTKSTIISWDGSFAPCSQSKQNRTMITMMLEPLQKKKKKIKIKKKKKK